MILNLFSYSTVALLIAFYLLYHIRKKQKNMQKNTQNFCIEYSARICKIRKNYAKYSKLGKLKKNAE